MAYATTRMSLTFNESSKGLVNFGEIEFYSSTLSDVSAKVTSHWTDVEFARLSLGDARFDKRVSTLMERFRTSRTASISEICNSWSKNLCGLSFSRNDEVTWEDILVQHWGRIHERMQPHPVELCI